MKAKHAEDLLSANALKYQFCNMPFPDPYSLQKHMNFEHEVELANLYAEQNENDTYIPDIETQPQMAQTGHATGMY